MSDETDPLDSLEDDFFEEGMSDLERKAEAQRKIREADEIEHDLKTGGPLGTYVQIRRKIGLSALRNLVSVSPEDAVNIARLQVEVREYLRVCEWITSEFKDAQMAEHMINTDFGPQDGQATDD